VLRRKGGSVSSNYAGKQSVASFHHSQVLTKLQELFLHFRLLRYTPEKTFLFHGKRLPISANPFTLVSNCSFENILDFHREAEQRRANNIQEELFLLLFNELNKN